MGAATLAHEFSFGVIKVGQVFARLGQMFVIPRRMISISRRVISILLRIFPIFPARLNARPQITRQIFGVSFIFILTFAMSSSIFEIPRPRLIKICRDITKIAAELVIREPRFLQARLSVLERFLRRQVSNSPSTKAI